MPSTAIAIIGMAGRFPGARNIAEFWQNLKNGVESIRSFSDAELLAAGVPSEELAQPEYVKSGVILQDLDQFDAAFFGFSPKDAAIMDPQHRLFLECAWEALETAGHTPTTFPGSIGVYAGSGMNSYMIYNLLTNRKLMESAGLFLIRQTGNDKDVLATRVSYELNLHGPSINVQTACSTSLVAVHLACQSLLNQECDMALAGGVTIEFPHGHGYLYREGEILSRDGHCRAFDADSSGTVFSSGAGLVVLRRLEDALADHDTISAVILGSAINNDGARKAGYLAPSVDGQSEVIAEALGVAGVEPGDISYVETHGTGTKVGDPIEIKALTQAFQRRSKDSGFCAIGSLKASIGHLDTAAGVAGLIKTVLALKHRQIPPSLHFHKPNPLIDFSTSPFYVNTALTEWEAKRGPRRAGVTSLGIGGTNAHVVLEEASLSSLAKDPIGAEKPFQLLVMSAKTTSALEKIGQNLSAYLQETPEARLKDIAYTLQVGRKEFAQRSCGRSRLEQGSRQSSVRRKFRPRLCRAIRIESSWCSFPVLRSGLAIRQHGPRVVRHRASVPRPVGFMRGATEAIHRPRFAYDTVSPVARIFARGRETFPHMFHPAGSFHHRVCSRPVVDKTRNCASRYARPQYWRVCGGLPFRRFLLEGRASYQCRARSPDGRNATRLHALRLREIRCHFASPTNCPLRSLTDPSSASSQAPPPRFRNSPSAWKGMALPPERFTLLTLFTRR